MPVVAKDHVSNFPILSSAGATSHTTSVQAPGLGGRTFASPTGASRTLVVGNASVRLNPTAQTPGGMADTLRAAGVDVTLDRYGRLVFNGVSAVSGDQELLVALGLA